MSKSFLNFKFILLIIFSSYTSTPCQIFEDFSKDEERRYNLSVVDTDLIKITDKLTGKTFLKTNELSNFDENNFDFLVDLRNIDTSQFSNLYRYWNEIPVYKNDSLIITDVNSDGKKEVYGNYQFYLGGYSSIIYEIDHNGSYDSIYTYLDPPLGIWCIRDIENDGTLELISTVRVPNTSDFYINILTVDSSTGYPTKPKLVFDPTIEPESPVDISLYDMDGDESLEMIYRLEYSNKFQIAKYDSAENTFKIVYENKPSILHPKGFSFGDFDSDGKQNFVASNYRGEIFVYEYVEANNYNVIRIDSIPVKNTFLQFFTHDFDLNGKPELWISGDGYISGVNSTIIYIYESDKDDLYSVKYKIGIIGSISFYASNMQEIDLDNDGLNEILLCIHQHLLVFKFINGNFQLYYLKRNELLNQNSVYWSATSSDLDGDDYPEILISMDLVENNSLRGFTKIYKKTGTVGFKDEICEQHDYWLSNAYPNPFNPSTTIRYAIPKDGMVTLKIYDILGSEVKTLVNSYQSAGEHFVKFDGRGLASGVYFYSLTAGDFSQTKKMILLP